MTTRMQNITTVYTGIVLVVCVEGMNIPKDVLSTQAGVTLPLYVSNVTDNSMVKIVTKLICFSLNKKKQPWKRKCAKK